MPPTEGVTNIAGPIPEPILPGATDAFRAIAGGSNRNAPPAMGEREAKMARLGAQPGVPFHDEGLPTMADIGVKARKDSTQQLTYLAKQYGAENIRMNELEEPVVRIKGEDYVVDPHKLTLNSLTGLMAYAPEVLASALALKMGGKGGAGAGVIKDAIMGALAGQAAGAGKEVATKLEDQQPVELPKILAEHLAQAVPDAMAGGAIGGMGKAVQLVKGVVQGKGLPNPLAGTKLFAPANPELTGEGVAAAGRLAAKTGIPADLSPAESTGIPLLAMFETRQENIAPGASIMIQAQERRDASSRAWQNWMTKPETLGTDEEVGRRGLGVLKASVDPMEKDVALARFKMEAEKAGDTRLLQSMRAKGEADAQKKVLASVGMKELPSQGVPLTETGDLIRQRVLAARDESKAAADAAYETFYAHPAVMDPVIPGKGLKGALDATLNDLPKVTGAGGVTTPIDTPIRGRLQELSGKLGEGNVSINDLKQIRTDVGDAITRGEAVPGVREGRLKQLYGQVSMAIEKGLDNIGDPELKKAWETATSTYKAHAEKFSDRNLAPLFKEADQAGLGNAAFTKQLMAKSDSYNALRGFLGTGSSEIEALHRTVRNSVMADALADGSSTAVSGERLIAGLEALRKSNPELYAGAFGDKGNQLIKQAKQLGGFQKNLPGEELEALLNPANRANNTLISLQAAEQRLEKEYTNGALKDFIQGKRADLEPDKFIRFLPSYKLSDVKDVMARLGAGDPETAEQVARKTVQGLLSDARRNPTPSDTLKALQGKGGDIVSATGIKKALGVGDQQEKYRAILGPDLFETLVDYTKRELLREEKLRVGRGTGMLAKGNTIDNLEKALTPGEGKKGGLLKEGGLLLRDKTISAILASPRLRDLLLAPHKLGDLPMVMRAVVSSGPFIRAMAEEYKDPGAAYKALSQLKGAFGTADGAGGDEAGKDRMTDEEFMREAARPQ